MSRNVSKPGRSQWWIVAGIALTAGCADTSAPAPARLDDVPLACAPQTAVYRITHVDPSGAAANALDLDGDGRPDNALGRAHDALVAIEPAFAVAPRFDARLAQIPWLVGVDRCGDEIRVTLDQGVPLGDEPLLPRVLPRAVGVIAAGELTASDGVGALPLIALGDAAATRAFAGWRTADQLAIHATLTDEALTGTFGAALPAEVVRADLASPIAAFLTAQPATDALRQEADDDGDGTVSPDELAGTAAYRSLTASDLVLDETPAVSIAFAFTATRLR